MFALCLIALAACYVPNEAYKKPCDTDVECPSDAPICDANKVCVVCTPERRQLCSAEQPICRIAAGEQNRCDACKAHPECPESGVCTATGACGDDKTVAYVTPGAMGVQCTKASPCSSLASAIATGRPYVLMTGGQIEDNVTVVDRKVTVIGASGAKLVPSANGAILTVGANAEVVVQDLEISGGTSATGHGVVVTGTGKLTLERVRLVSNTGFGANVINGGTLKLSRTQLRLNTAGGLRVDGGSFDVTNSLIDFNGNAGSNVGGVLLINLGSVGNRFAHNTVTGNNATAGVTTGVSCNIVTQAFDLTHNIIWGNSTMGGSKPAEGATNCRYQNSIIGPGAVPGTAILDMNPKFINDASNFHLQSDSMARDAGDALSGIDIDYDGDPRPATAGTRVDYGYDEVR